MGQEEKDEKGFQEFGDDSRDGNTYDIEVKDHDEEEVKADIDDATDKQNIERTLGIAHAPKESGAEIEDHQERHSKEVNAKVGDGFVDIEVRRLHKFQQSWGDKPSCDSEEDT